MSAAKAVGSSVAGAVVIATGAFVWVMHSADPGLQYRTAAATLGTVTQTVSLSGNLTPVGETDLNFSGSGKVTSVDGRPAVKLSDNPEKATGMSSEVDRYLRVFGNAGRVRSAVHV